MVNYRSGRRSVAVSSRAAFPNLFAYDLGRGARGALFTGNSTDAVEEQSPNVARAAFGAQLKASNMPAEDEHVSAATNHHDPIVTPFCHPRQVAQFRETDFVIVGCGGFGSQVAIQLAALGARHFLLVDGDRIDESNLNQLPWASESDLGRLKTDKLATYLAARFSADVFALPELAEGGSVLRLIADYAHNPFVVLTGDDPRPGREFLTACHASAAGLPPHLHAGRSEAPSTDSNIASFAVSRIIEGCISKDSDPLGRRWVLDLKSDQAKHRYPSRNPVRTVPSRGYERR